MFIKLFTYLAVWLGLGFAAGSTIWLGLILTKRGVAGRGREPVSLNGPSLGRVKVATTYRILDRGSADAVQDGDAPARRKHGARELLNYPR